MQWYQNVNNMRRILSTVATGLLASIVFTCLSAQNYIRLSDPSGFDTDSYQAALESAASNLLDIFPVAYQDSFRVFDQGLYLHNGVFCGELRGNVCKEHY